MYHGHGGISSHLRVFNALPWCVGKFVFYLKKDAENKTHKV